MNSLNEILKIYYLNYASLAEKLGISRANVYNWAKGKRKIPEKYLEQLSNVFGLPKECFTRELTNVELLEVRKKSIKNEIDKTTFKIDTTIINADGEEIEAESEYVDSNLIELHDDINTRIKEEEIINRIKGTIKNMKKVDPNIGIISDNRMYMIRIYEKFVQLIEDANISSYIISSVLNSISVAYSSDELIEISNHEKEISKIINEMEYERRAKKDEFIKKLKQAKELGLFD